GVLDLAVTLLGRGGVTLLPGNGDGTFQTGGRIYFAGRMPVALVVGHFNGDEALHVITANSRHRTVSPLLGTGDGSFQPAVQYAAGESPVGLAVGDFDGDGALDLAVADAGAGAAVVLRGGSFSLLSVTPLGGSPAAVAAADFNGDGLQDL